MVNHTHHPHAQETEEGECIEIQDQPGLHSSHRVVTQPLHLWLKKLRGGGREAVRARGPEELLGDSVS